MIETIIQGLLAERLQEESLSIAVTSAAALEDNYLEQLIGKSRQPHINVYEGLEDVGTPEAPGRFRTIEDYRTWAGSKERFMLLLLDTARPVDDIGTPDIGCIAWFGHREHQLAPGRTVTFSMRNYAADKQRNWGQYTGRGLAVPFMLTAHSIARGKYPNEKLWLDLTAGNHASHQMCLRSGYVEIARHDDSSHDDQTRIVMVNDTVFAQPL